MKLSSLSYLLVLFSTTSVAGKDVREEVTDWLGGQVASWAGFSEECAKSGNYTSQQCQCDFLQGACKGRLETLEDDVPCEEVAPCCDKAGSDEAVAACIDSAPGSLDAFFSAGNALEVVGVFEFGLAAAVFAFCFW